MFAEAHGRAVLAGLEHLDDRYLKAVGYATKSKRVASQDGAGGDIAGDDADAVAGPRRGGAHCHLRSGEGLWPSAMARKNSGWTASAQPPSAATNAFKINEDVVIPLPRMAEYTDGSGSTSS